MKIAHVKFENSTYNYTTSINGTEESIKNYFIGKSFNLGSVEDDIQICIDCIVEDSKQEIIDQLRSLKTFSYNDLTKHFESLQHRITIPILVKKRFLEYFNNHLIHSYATETFNFKNNKIEQIDVHVRGGIASCEDVRVNIIDHDNLKDN